MAKLIVASLRASYEGPDELSQTSDGKTIFVRRWNAKSEAHNLARKSVLNQR